MQSNTESLVGKPPVTREDSALAILTFLSEKMHLYQKKVITRLSELDKNDPENDRLNEALQSSCIDLIPLILPTTTPAQAGEIMIEVTNKFRTALGEMPISEKNSATTSNVQIP